jgi:hypothetical protein
MRTGTIDSAAEKKSPTTKSCAASAFRDPTAAKMTAVQTRSVETSAKITGMATLCFRRGDPTSRRSRVESADLLIDLYHYMQGPSWKGDEQRSSPVFRFQALPAECKTVPSLSISMTALRLSRCRQ